jgi:hypothetical protein
MDTDSTSQEGPSGLPLTILGTTTLLSRGMDSGENCGCLALLKGGSKLKTELSSLEISQLSLHSSPSLLTKGRPALEAQITIPQGATYCLALGIASQPSSVLFSPHLELRLSNCALLCTTVLQKCSNCGTKLQSSFATINMYANMNF